jgi:hypothetical protein
VKLRRSQSVFPLASRAEAFLSEGERASAFVKTSANSLRSEFSIEDSQVVAQYFGENEYAIYYSSVYNYRYHNWLLSSQVNSFFDLSLFFFSRMRGTSMKLLLSLNLQGKIFIRSQFSALRTALLTDDYVKRSFSPTVVISMLSCRTAR